MNTYILVAYKPSSKNWNGCHCHGDYHHYDSNLIAESFATATDLINRLVSIKNHQFDNLCKNEKWYDITIFKNNELIFKENSLHLFKVDSGEYYLSWDNDNSTEYSVDEIDLLNESIHTFMSRK
jgi:hypothetical protein